MANIHVVLYRRSMYVQNINMEENLDIDRIGRQTRLILQSFVSSME